MPGSADSPGDVPRSGADTGDPARLVEIDQLFSRALDQPEAQRAGFVIREAGDDLDLRRSVDELLAAAADDSETLLPGGALGSHLWDDLSERVEARVEPLAAGDSVGRYRVLEEIDRGGMSVVYLAARADGDFEQRVALKVLKRGTDTDEVLRRFAQERQILAALTHPGIARLLDGGATADGRPYFVLERVEGVPIDRYCRERELPLEERLRLVIQVGRALDHAHRKLVVHRDLKPSNILVDADGQAKLLDFGIAKLTDTERWGATMGVEATLPLTRTYMRLLTPDYASPEQVRGEPITTATDIYQLGLLLYELLTGRRVVPARNKTPAELERAICEEEPPAPSSAVGDTQQLPVSPDGARPRTRRRRLKRHLRGDLDNIVLKALRKQPERRYSSVRELVEDLQRFLDGRPVRARGESWIYRAGKFVRRHALPLAAAAAVVVVAAALSVVYTVRLAEERDRARQQAERAERVAHTLTQMFEIADPVVSGTALTARQLLDQGLVTVDRELADEPLLHAEMQLKLAELYDKLTFYERALELALPAIAVLDERLDESDPRLAQGLSTLGLMLYQEGALEAGRAYLERAIRGFESAGTPSVEYFQALNRLANLEKRQGRIEVARRLFEDTLGRQIEALGADHEEVGKTYNDYALALDRLGEVRAARDALVRSMEIRRLHHPGQDPLFAISLDSLAHIHRRLGDLEAAQQAADESLAMLRATVGELHPDVAAAYNTQGALSLDRGEVDQAIDFLNLSAYVYRRTRGEDHFHRSFPLIQLGDAFRAQERWADARRRYQTALDLRLAALGPDHDLVSAAKAKLGLVAWAEGELEEAEALSREAVEIARRAFDSPNSRLGDRLLQLGELLVELDRTEEAEPYLEQAVELLEGDEDTDAPRARQALARCRRALQRSRTIAP